MEAAPRDLTIFILAGGKSTRMGADKAFLEFESRTLLSRALNLARSVTPNVSIVGSREKFAAYAPVVEDIFRDCGPLGGIHAALRASQTEINLILAVDMPFVPVEFLDYLIATARCTLEAVVVVPHCEAHLHTLCATYRRPFADVAEKNLRAGQNKIDRTFSEVPTRIITEEELQTAGFSPAIFRNLNTPEQLEAERMAFTGADLKPRI
jgi:molybdenum cofactor guanylyltransferase